MIWFKCNYFLLINSSKQDINSISRTALRVTSRAFYRFILIKPASYHTHRFWLWRKDNLVKLPEEPSITWTVDAVCFSGEATEFLKCVCWRTFYKQGPVRRWICTLFNTERWSSPSYKRSRSWFRTDDGKWNGIKCLCFVGVRRSSARPSLAPPTACLQELCFFRKEL